MDAMILELGGRGLNRYERIATGTTRIGRALDNDIILSDPTVAPYHLEIVCHPDQSVELINLTEVNPTRIDDRPISTHPVERTPVELEIGRIHARLLPRNQPVAATRPLAGRGNHRHLFGHVLWAALLVVLCIVVDAVDFYLNAYNTFKWSELLKYILRETILTIGAFVLALAILERLLINRWEVRQLVTSVCLVFLLYSLIATLAHNLDYLLSASWPSSLLFFSWYLFVIPGAICLYLVHISHLPRYRSLVLAWLIASPIALPAILQSPQLQSMFDNFQPISHSTCIYRSEVCISSV